MNKNIFRRTLLIAPLVWIQSTFTSLDHLGIVELRMHAAGMNPQSMMHQRAYTRGGISKLSSLEEQKKATVYVDAVVNRGGSPTVAGSTYVSEGSGALEREYNLHLSRSLEGQSHSLPQLERLMPLEARRRLGLNFLESIDEKTEEGCERLRSIHNIPDISHYLPAAKLKAKLTSGLEHAMAQAERREVLPPLRQPHESQAFLQTPIVSSAGRKLSSTPTPLSSFDRKEERVVIPPVLCPSNERERGSSMSITVPSEGAIVSFNGAGTGNNGNEPTWAAPSSPAFSSPLQEIPTPSSSDGAHGSRNSNEANWGIHSLPTTPSSPFEEVATVELEEARASRLSLPAERRLTGSASSNGSSFVLEGLGGTPSSVFEEVAAPLPAVAPSGGGRSDQVFSSSSSFLLLPTPTTARSASASSQRTAGSGVSSIETNRVLTNLPSSIVEEEAPFEEVSRQ